MMATGYKTDDFTFKKMDQWSDTSSLESLDLTKNKRSNTNENERKSSGNDARGKVSGDIGQLKIDENGRLALDRGDSDSEPGSKTSSPAASEFGLVSDQRPLVLQESPFQTMKVEEKTRPASLDAATTRRKDTTSSGSKRKQSIRKSLFRDKFINPITLVKKMTTRKEDEKKRKEEEKEEREKYFREVLKAVRVDRLPQVFVAKYLGKREVAGIWGIKFSRKPVEDMVEAVSKLKKGQELPLVALRVGRKGLSVVAHKDNKMTAFEGWWTPIDYISYGVQDIQFSRIFAMITIQEISSQSKTMECHAFVCSTAISARKVALSMALGFKVYAKSLGGKPHRFQVDLRSPEQITAEAAAESDEADA